MSLLSLHLKRRKSVDFPLFFRKQKSFVFIFCIGPIFKTMMYTEEKMFPNAFSNVVSSSYTLNVILVEFLSLYWETY